MLAIAAVVLLQAGGPVAELQTALTRLYVEPRAVYRMKLQGIKTARRNQPEPIVYLNDDRVVRIEHRGVMGTLKDLSGRAAPSDLSVATVYLQPGERVVISAVETTKDDLRFRLERVDTPGGEAWQSTIAYHVGKATLPRVTVEDARKSLAMILEPETPEPATATVDVGMTPEDVENAMGSPARKVSAGGKTIWTYSDGIKVTFVAGKVSSVD